MFNKKIFVIILIFGSLSIFNTNCKCNKISNGSDITDFQQEYYFPEELSYSNPGDSYVLDKLYPIGWSKDGHFAFMTEASEEGLGIYMLRIEILNTINGKIEWTWETDTENENYREEVWKDNYDLFKEELNKYNILQTKNNLIAEAFFTYNNEDYYINLKHTTEVNRDYGFDVIVGTEVYINSEKLGKKKIYEYYEPEYSMMLGQIVAGHIISPYEDRLLVILKNERWGWEGPPNVVYFTLTGSNLNTGFQTDE